MHANTHTHTHPQHTRKHKQTQTHTHTHCTHPQHTCTQTQTHTHTHTHTYKHTHTHTHTHTARSFVRPTTSTPSSVSRGMPPTPDYRMPPKTLSAEKGLRRLSGEQSPSHPHPHHHLHPNLHHQHRQGSMSDENDFEEWCCTPSGKRYASASLLQVCVVCCVCECGWVGNCINVGG